MNPFSSLQSIFLALQGEDDPSHVAAGFALGAALGLVPKGNLFAVLLILLFFFFNVDKGMAFLTAAVFTPLGYILDPFAHRLGRSLLTAGVLKPLWTWLYNLPIVPWTKFNNTVVLGNLVLALALLVPLYAVCKRSVLHYRSHWKETVDRWPIVRTINAWGWVQRLLAAKKAVQR